MIISLFRWFHNLCCPECDAVQPVVGLTSTLRGGLVSVALNDFDLCILCGHRLRMVYRYSTAATVIWLVSVAIFLVGALLLVIVPFIHFSLSRFGVVGLISFPSAVFLLWGFQGLLYRYYFPLFREVVAL